MIKIPIFQYECSTCGFIFEALVIRTQSDMGEPYECPQCHAPTIFKIITAPAQVRMDGKRGLRTVPDPTPPLQNLKEKGPREGCEGGYADLEEFRPTKRKKTSDGNWEWEEPKKQYFDMKKEK